LTVGAVDIEERAAAPKNDRRSGRDDLGGAQSRRAMGGGSAPVLGRTCPRRVDHDICSEIGIGAMLREKSFVGGTSDPHMLVENDAAIELKRSGFAIARVLSGRQQGTCRAAI